MANPLHGARQARYTAEEILTAKARIEELHGKWTAHNIRLTDEIYTIAPAYDWAHHRGKWFGLIGETFLRRPLRYMRVLDLGCLEGGITLALGPAGGEVVGIDIREANLAKAAFARDVLGMANVRFVQGDMLELPKLDLGSFDMIICAGTLYHVDAPDLLPFLRMLRQSCSGIVIFDTHFAVERREQFISPEGCEYYGRTFVETHHYTDDIEQKKQDRWGSLHNNLSFWPTERSLTNMLIDAGFQFVTRPVAPVMEWPWQDRGFWVAFSNIEHLLSEEYPYGTGRLSDPSGRAPYHEMLDNPLQRNCTNPHTRLLKDE